MYFKTSSFVIIYEAYAGCYPYGHTLYLGCIEKNKIKFFDIQLGKFEEHPYKDEDWSGTF